MSGAPTAQVVLEPHKAHDAASVLYRDRVRAAEVAARCAKVGEGK